MLHSLPLTGDIILMNAKPTVMAAQMAFRRRKSRYSHAAVTLSHRSYLDSITAKGVGLRLWADLDPEMPVLAYRFQQSDDEAHRRMIKMLELYGKRYNFALGLKNLPVLRTRFSDALYCSELVAQVYTRAELGQADEGTILPADLERLEFDPRWIDVTAAYKPLLGVVPDLNNPDADELFVKTALSTQAVDQFLEEARAVMEQMDALGPHLQNRPR